MSSVRQVKLAIVKFTLALWPALFLANIPAAHANPGLYQVRDMPGVGSTLGGYVIPRYQVVLSAQEPGRVTFVKGGAGIPIENGDVLVRLDRSALLAKRAEAIASFYSAEATWRNTQIQYSYQLRQYNPMSSWINPFAWAGQGMSSLLGQGPNNPTATYGAGVANRSAAQAIAWANMQSAQAKIKQIDSALRDTLSIAPFDGVILSKKVNPGDTVQPGQPLMTVASSGQRQVELEVPDALAEQLHLDQGLWVNLSGSSHAVAASVAQIDPEADPRTHTVTLKLNLPANVQPRLGSYAQVVFPSLDKYAKTAVIPMSALLPGHTLPSVLVVKDGTSRLHVLRLGEALQGGLVQVLAGLRAGAWIVASPPPGAAAGYLPPKDKGGRPAIGAETDQ